MDQAVLLYSLLHLLTRMNFCTDSVPAFLSRYPARPGMIYLRKGKTSNTSPEGFPVRNSLLIFCRRAIKSPSLAGIRSPPKTDHSMFMAGKVKNPLFCLKEKQCTFQQIRAHCRETDREGKECYMLIECDSVLKCIVFL